MRDYSRVSPQFWTGQTGKKIRASGSQVQIVAMYLLTAPAANMIGLYYLPIATIAYETGIPFKGASKALRRVCELGFASYDHDNEVVFVREMARYQIGGKLKATDNRVKGIIREAEGYRKSPLYRDFYDRYGKAFSLPIPSFEESPFEAPSKPLRSQEQEQEQEQDINPPPSAADDEDSGEPPEDGAVAASQIRPQPKATGPLRELTDYYTAAWQRRYGRKYPFRKVDGVKCAELLKQCGGSMEDARAVIDRYLSDDGAFYNGHPVSLLTSAGTLPRFLAGKPKPVAPAAPTFREDN